MSDSNNAAEMPRSVEPRQRVQPTDPVRLIMKNSLAVVNSDDNLLQASDELAHNEIGIALVGPNGTDGLSSERGRRCETRGRAQLLPTCRGC